MSEPRKTSESLARPVSEPPGPAGEASTPGVGDALRQFGHKAFVENAALKFVALVLALTVFVLVHSGENDVYHPWVSVTYSQETDRVMVSKRVDQVQISVRGTRRRIKRLQKERLESIHIDASRLSNGDLLLEPSIFNLPEGVELISVNPPSIHLEFDQREEKMLTVEVDTVGLPARGFKIGSAMSTPASVRVSGARKALAGVQTIATESVNLTGRTKPFEGAVELLNGDLDVLDAPTVNVNVQIMEELQARELEDMQVALRGAEGLDVELSGFSLEPASAKVVMYGAVHALEAIDEGKVRVFVEMTTNDLMQGAPRRLEVRVEPMLTDIAYRITPTHIMLTAAEQVAPTERGEPVD
ncbi:MAG: hypothetical protein GY811_15935 [Myxococcales bacterium]|nr:hypothetical protein [Myxococcales bacterium]